MRTECHCGAEALSRSVTTSDTCQALSRSAPTARDTRPPLILGDAPSPYIITSMLVSPVL